MGEIYGEWCQCDNLQCDRDKSGQILSHRQYAESPILMISNDL